MITLSTTANKIFGVGLSHTGTRSLNEALEMLGIPSVHWPIDRTTHNELYNGIYRLSILEKYQALTDITAAAFFAQFDSCYPNSKFILTLRDKDAWMNKMKKRFSIPTGSEPPQKSLPLWKRIRGRLARNGGLTGALSRGKLAKWALFRAPRLNRIRFQRIATYGANWFTDPDRLSYVYDTHRANVISYFKDRPGDLLVMDVCGGEGWEKLCPFLGLAIPNVPFPHVRTT
jgi:hypothetical protein